ncbi:PAX3- and PAX7-binding protein 1 [Tyrophagus putrescentiae]|nr:PAX3- and PAX7-binding protein 1 [Tyrophagus putrescentiae]
MEKFYEVCAISTSVGAVWSKRTQIRQRIRSESEEEEDEGKTETSEPPKQEEKLENTGVSSLFKKQTEVDFKSFDSLTQSNENSQQSTDDNNSGGSGSGNGSLFGKQQAAAAKKKTAALSFLHHEDEEEVEDVFKVKKSAYSKRMERNKLKSLKSRHLNPSSKDKSEANGSGIRPDNQNTNRPSLKAYEDNTGENSKAAEAEAEGAITEEDIVICPGSDEDEDELEEEIRFMSKSSRRPPPAASKAAKSAASIGGGSGDQVHNFRNAVERGTIPDAKVIYELKKQRQKLARTRAADDFIPLNSDDEETLRQEANLLGGSGKGDEAGEEGDMDMDEDDDDDEEKGKSEFSSARSTTKQKNANGQRRPLEWRRRRRPNSSNFKGGRRSKHHDSSDSDSASELDRWEQEQIRKAVCLPSLAAFNETEFANRYLQQQPTSTLASNKHHRKHTAAARVVDNHSVVPIEIDGEDEEGSSTRRFGSALPSYITSSSSSTSRSENKTSSSGDFSSVHRRRAEFRRALATSLESNRALLDRVQLDLRLTEESIDGYRNGRENATLEDGHFYQETLEYVRNLCDCITDKRETLERLERQSLELWAGRAAKQAAEAAAEVTAQNDAAVQLIIHLKINAEQYAAVAHGTSIFEYYDFGGDEAKRQRLLALEAKMRRRSLASIVQGSSEDEDEEDHQTITFASIRRQAEELFEDTEEEYATLAGVLGRFAAWKRSRLDSYVESFVGAFVATFAGSKEEAGDPIPADGPEAKWRSADLELVPAAFEKVIFPRLTALIQGGVWSPLSRGQTARLAAFLKAVLKTCPTLVDASPSSTSSSSTPPALATLLQAIVQRLEAVLDSEIFIPNMIPPEFFDRAAKRSHYETLAVTYVTAFFHRQFWAAVALLRSAVSLRGLVAEAVLKELALERLLGRVLLISVARSAADGDALLTQVDQIVEALPEEWCARGGIGSSQQQQQQQHPTIAKLADLIQQLAEAPSRRPGAPEEAH